MNVSSLTMRLLPWWTVATALLAFGCEKGSGGLGLGFADSPMALRAPTLGLQIERLFLPQGPSAGAAYVEVCNRSGKTIDTTATQFLLMASSGQARLKPAAAAWQPGACETLSGADLASLGLVGQAGELALLRDGTFFEAYAAWGAQSGSWPTQFASVARRLGLSANAVRPLPLMLQAGQAIALAAHSGADHCTSATLAAPAASALAACVAANANELTAGITLSRVVAAGSDPGGSAIELLNRSDSESRSACGLNVCTPTGCALVACTNAAGGLMAPGARLRLPLVGSRVDDADLPLRLSPLQQNDVVALLAPGDAPADDAPRVMGYVQLSPTPLVAPSSTFFAKGLPPALAAWEGRAALAPRLAGESSALDANHPDPLSPAAWALRAVLPGGTDDGSQAMVACSAPIAPRAASLIVGGVEAVSPGQWVVGLRNNAGAELDLGAYSFAVGNAKLPLTAGTMLAPNETWRVAVAASGMALPTTGDQTWSVQPPAVLAGECSVVLRADGTVVAHVQWQTDAPLADSLAAQAVAAGAWPHERCRHSRFAATPSSRLSLRTKPTRSGQSPADYALAER